MKNKTVKYKKAFTIAEVLVAMVIMAMALMALSPVLTKRKPRAVMPSGSWECYLKQASDGSYSHYSRMNGGSETEEGPNCLFTPPANSQKFLVTVIGGGGGGASGTSTSFDAISYGDSTGFKVDRRGNYDIILIGGGGSASARSIDGYGNISGSAGEVKYLDNRSLDPGVYILKAGLGGIAGGLSKAVNPDSEEESNVVDEKCSLRWQDICAGEDGGKSLIVNSQGTIIAEARGGYGGGKDSTTKAPDSDGLAINDTSSCNSRKGGDIAEGGKITRTSTVCTNVLRAIGAESDTLVGAGGSRSNSSVAYPGYTGIAMISSSLFYSGGAGKTGNIAFTSIDEINEPVVVMIGKGGAGATLQNNVGSPGENSSFGFYITAKGGDGGQPKAESKTGINSKIDGEDPSASPFTGTAYGVGGKGGYAYSFKSTSTGSDNIWGNGLDGSPGYVRVEWN